MDPSKHSLIICIECEFITEPHGNMVWIATQWSHGIHILNNTVVVLLVHFSFSHSWLKASPCREKNLLTVGYNITVLMTIDVLTFSLFFPSITSPFSSSSGKQLLDLLAARPLSMFSSLQLWESQQDPWHRHTFQYCTGGGLVPQQ